MSRGQSSQGTDDVHIAWENIKNAVKVTPTMVFSVIGDSDSFVPRPWPRTVFQTALIEAAKSGGETWILYRGNEHGVSKVVREAYENYGDMEFGKKNRAMHDPPKKNGIPLDVASRHIKLISIAGKETQEIFPELELAAPHFSTNMGETDEYLSRFEKYVSDQEVAFFSQRIDYSMPVPIAVIVCEGDLGTIAHISKTLLNKLPVIIMKGSGKAADLVLDFLESEEQIRKKASVLFGIKFDGTNYSTLEDHLKTIKNNKDLIGIFDLNSDDPLKLSNIVGEAVVSCWSMANILPSNIKAGENDTNQNSSKSMSRQKTLAGLNGYDLTGFSLASKLMIRSNSIGPEINDLLEDYKKESRPYVLNPKYTSPSSLPLYFYFGYQLLQETNEMKKSGPILLLEALKANRCDYVRVLLDQGVEFKMENLPELYEQTVSCKDCKFKEDDCLHMQWILKQIHESQAKQLCHKYRSISTKSKKKDLNATKKSKYEKKIDKLQTTVQQAARGLCRKILRYQEDKSDDKEGVEEDNICDILLWAIFANRKELAEICWLRSKNHLLTGLVCSAILQKLSNKANNVKEQILSAYLADHAKLFEKRCIHIMDRMYEEDTKSAIDSMDDEAVIWGIHSSPLTFAYENFMYDVVAHTCSQKNMNKQWYNNLAPDLKPFLKSAVSRPKKFLTAPLTKYVFNYMMFFTMLVMYSAFVLTSIHTTYYVQDIARIFEYYVYFWGAGDFIEELISCFGCLESRGRSHRGYYSRMKRYLYDFWNVVDLLSYILLICALFVRHFYPSETFTIARRMFSLSLLVMYLRFLEVFLIHRKLGPTLIMIKEMLKDLIGFMLIAVFVILGVGIYYHANLFPDHQTIWGGDWTEWRIWKIIYYPYWQMYAELNLEFLEARDDEFECTNVTSVWESGAMERCPEKDWTVSAVTGVYLLLSNLLLVNLVIAMFSYTFERVQENSEKLWRFERYTVINDYDWRIPSPINLIFLPYRFCCCPTREDCCLQKCRGACNRKAVEKEKKKKKTDVIYRKKFQKIIAYRIHNKNNSNVKNTWNKIIDVVEVTPTMVFSVIGDSDSFVPRPWPKTVFQTALIDAAKSGGETWILYSGSEQGVSKAVEDAYLKYGNREFGTKNFERPIDYTNRHIKLISTTDTTVKDENHKETVVQCNLQYGELDCSLLDFEKFVSDQEVSFFSQMKDFRMPIPIAIIVCEGDVQTVAHTAEALQHRLPVIIMKGSGKAADLIPVYLERSDQLRKEAGILFGMKFEDTLFSTLKKDLEIIRENKDLVGIFDLNSDDPLKLSSIVGEAVVTCWSVEKNKITMKKEVEKDTNQDPQETTPKETVNSDGQEGSLGTSGSSITMKQLKKNSMTLDEMRIRKLIESFKKQSRRDVLDPSFTSPTSLPLYFYFGYQVLQETNTWEECGHILLLEALKENRCDYVIVLLDRGVKLTKENLPELYAQTVSCEECKFKKHDCFHMQWILKQILPPEAETICHKYNHALKYKNKSPDKYEGRIKTLKHHPTKSVAASAKRLCCKILQYEALDIKDQTNEGTLNTDTSDILLWAIFANRKEIAEICWLRGTDHILSGLICSVLLHKLSKKALRVKEHCLSEDLEEHAKLFEQRCIRIMDGMYKEDTTHAAKAMKDEAMIWGVKTSPLAIAYENSMYEIVAHTCSRKHLNIKWYNELPPDLFSFYQAARQKKLQFIKAPLTKYIINYITFFTVLFMYSAFVLTSVHTNYYEQGEGKFFEYYVYIWAFGDFIEELISCFNFLGSESRFRRSFLLRIKRYLYDFWNAVDLLSYILLIIALFVRHFYPSENFTIARRMFSFSLLIMYLRFLEVFLIHRTLGPTLIMIKEMLKDLLGFLLIALFVVLGVGCYYHANQYPDYQNFWSGNWTEWRIWDLLYYPYWQIYAELNLDYLQVFIIINFIFLIIPYKTASLAQMARAFASQAEGWVLKSLPRHTS
uniref:Uncharacterized protein LOC111116490 n=1 Tax=Crassostrea virginica TaxID=6565 RepID=A0A8B8C7V5_CRAVI|nr:uncharacterized protein LOC111116490 [Crassostrea virginica]